MIVDPSSLVDQEAQVLLLEELLALRLPVAYRRFLFARGSQIVGGHLILGLPLSEDPTRSALGATQLLRAIRPDLRRTLLAIGVEADRVLCLDSVDEQDAILLDVPLDPNEKTLHVANSFREFMKEYDTFERDFTRELSRLRNRKREFETLSGKRLSRLERPGSKQTLFARPQQWHPRTIRAHDLVIALTSFRYQHRLEALEVDAFYAFDDPRYDPGASLRALIIALFGEALHYGGKLEIAFTRDEREDSTGTIPQELQHTRSRRVSCRVPEALTQLAASEGIVFGQGGEDGRILHKEAVSLWWKLLGLGTESSKAAEESEKAGCSSREYLAAVIFAGIWTKEEASWLLLNAPRPEAVLLGTCLPERRLSYVEAIEYGRAAILASGLARQITLGLSHGIQPEEKFVADVSLRPSASGWEVSCSMDFSLPWQGQGKETVRIEKHEGMFLLVRPVLPSISQDDEAWLTSQLQLLQRSAGDTTHRCLLLSMEFRQVEWIQETASMLAKEGVYLLFAPRRLDIYDEEVANRMARARRLRRFPDRLDAIRLKVFEVPGTNWRSPGLSAVTRDAETMARWIGKRIDMPRARREFGINCTAAERIVLESGQCTTLAELDGEESIVCLKAIEWTAFSQPVSVPFVRPQSMRDFRKKLDKNLRSKLKLRQNGSGYLITHPCYEKSRHASSTKVHPGTLGAKAPTNFSMSDFNSKASVTNRVVESDKVARRVDVCLRYGEALAVSYVRHEVLPEILRHHLYWGTQEHVSITRHRVVRSDTLWASIRAIFGFPLYGISHKSTSSKLRSPREPIGLRVAYSDGTEGIPYPCYSLDPIKQPSLDRFLKLNVGLVSMRHREVDGIISRYLIRNRELQRDCESSAEQEQLAFERTFDFISRTFTLISGKDVRAAIRGDADLRMLVELLKLEKVRANGLEIHIFQTTGLEPAIMGVYRAVAAAIMKYRGKLLVVPRLLVKRTNQRSRNKVENLVAEEDYAKAEPWF